MLSFASAYVLEGEIPLRTHTSVQMHSPTWMLPSVSFNNELLMACRSTTDLSTRIKKAYETYLLGFEEVGCPPPRPSGIAALFDLFSCFPCLVASQQRKRKLVLQSLLQQSHLAIWQHARRHACLLAKE